jgi:hypothetical protein
MSDRHIPSSFAIAASVIPLPNSALLPNATQQSPSNILQWHSIDISAVKQRGGLPPTIFEVTIGTYPDRAGRVPERTTSGDIG